MVVDYSRRLILALRKRDVAGAQIAEAVAEVEAHSTESGEPPARAFGPVDQYAEAVVSTLGARGRGGAVRAVAGVGLGCFALSAVATQIALPAAGVDVRWLVISAWTTVLALHVIWAAMARGRRVPWLRIAVLVMLGAALALSVAVVVLDKALPWPTVATSAFATPALLACGAAVGVAGEWRDRVLDPRTGADRHPLPRWPVAAATLVLLAPVSAALALRLAAS